MSFTYAVLGAGRQGTAAPAAARVAPRVTGPAAGWFRPNAVHLTLPDDGRFRQAPSRVIPRRSSTGGHRPWHLPFPAGRLSIRVPAT